MALDIRLDFIKDIRNDYIDQMTALRKKFIEIDEMLKRMDDEAIGNGLTAARRSIGLARTANESACQSAIKSLCLLGEITS